MKVNIPKILVFVLTFFAYAGLHSLRQGWSYSKPQLQKQLNVDRNYLGMVDTLYLISYSIGMATIGNLARKIPLNVFVGVGMVLATFCYVSFSINFQITGNFSYTLVTIMMCLNGFFQSTGWPGVMGIFGNWFGKGKRGVLMGIWAINANIGNIMAQLICNVLESYKISWTFNFITTACFCLITAILVLAVLQQKPRNKVNKNQNQDLIYNERNINQDQSLVESELTERMQEQQDGQNGNRNINVFTALCLPRVPYYVLGYACLKGCIYGLLFWLPQYLDKKDPILGQQKGYISSMLDVGSFVGGLAIGYLSDRSHYRALFLSPLLIISAGIMFLISFAFTNVPWMYYIALLGIGLTIGGPYNIIGTVITIDLGEQAGPRNVATVSALVQGSAAIFAAASQYLISITPFETIFYIFCGQCIIASLSLMPLFLKQLQEYRESCEEQKIKLQQI